MELRAGAGGPCPPPLSSSHPSQAKCPSLSTPIPALPHYSSQDRILCLGDEPHRATQGHSLPQVSGSGTLAGPGLTSCSLSG